MEKKKQKIQPGKTRKLFCPGCGEIMVKVYPNSSVFPQEGGLIPPCFRCQNAGNRTANFNPETGNKITEKDRQEMQRRLGQANSFNLPRLPIPSGASGLYR